MSIYKNLHFDGDTYDAKNDQVRLTGQILRIFNLMKDGDWRTLTQISFATGDPHASVSARLRDFRKDRFGNHTVNRRHRGKLSGGLHEYQLILNKVTPPGQGDLF